MEKQENRGSLIRRIRICNQDFIDLVKLELIWFSQNKGCHRLNVGNHLEKNLVHFIYVRYKLLNVQVDIILLNIETYMVQMTIHAKATGFGFVKKIFHEAS